MSANAPHHVNGKNQNGDKKKNKSCASVSSQPLDSLATLALAAETAANTDKPPYHPAFGNSIGKREVLAHLRSQPGRIKSMLGIRPEPETDKMRRCVELTDRVVNLANGLLQQQRDLLKTIKRISDEVCDSNEGSLEPQAEHPTYGDKN